MPKTVAERHDYSRGSGNRHPVDVLVGRRIRERRRYVGMNQAKLGDALGITFQQIQKYELGANRVSASRLSEIASLLNVPIAYFFGGLETNAGGGGPHRDETIELVRRYYAIPDPRVRRKFVELVKAAAVGVNA